jgi:hypothetical protein
MGKPYTEWYKMPGDEWVPMALADQYLLREARELRPLLHAHP